MLGEVNQAVYCPILRNRGKLEKIIGQIMKGYIEVNDLCLDLICNRTFYPTPPSEKTVWLFFFLLYLIVMMCC